MTTPAENLDPDFWRAQGCSARKREQESFERCDTDGFVSQWCLGLTARECDERARICEEGGTASFTGLYEGMRRVRAKRIDTPFGTSWLLDDSEAGIISRRGKPYLPTGRTSRVLARLGLQERYERAPAWARLDSPRGARGLSGLSSAFVRVYRTGDEWGSDALLEEHLCVQEHGA